MKVDKGLTCVCGMLTAAFLAGCSLIESGASWRDAERPLINAHRGGTFEYDDNAVGGFRRSLAAGVRGFETDVQLTKDDQLVIMHDKDISRTTTGRGSAHDLTLAELQSLKLKRSGENIPSVRQVAEVFRDRNDIRVEWEMKENTTVLGPERGALYLDLLYATVTATMAPGTFVFTSFYRDTLKMMKERHPDAPTGFINGVPMTKEHVDLVTELECASVAPLLQNATAELVDYAHAKGLDVTAWMMQNYRDYARATAIGADTGTSDHPQALLKKARARRRLVCLDLDATLCQHRSPIPPENLEALRELMRRYKCIMVGAGNAPRIYRQMGGFPIDIIGNYGMQEAKAEDGDFRIVRAVTNEVDRAFFREKTDYLRKKYGYTEYEGEPLEFHASGMVTFGLLGTKPSAEHKVAFDPDRKKRKAMYKEVCEIFRDYSVFIGGSTSFDFAGKQYNKYDAIMDYAKRNGYALDEIVFIGDDFGDGGGDSHVRLKGMDYIEIEDYRDFPREISVLLK